MSNEFPNIMNMMLTSQYRKLSATRQAMCIAVVDESENPNRPADAQWVEFRNNWPLRPYYLLQPGGDRFNEASLQIPPSMFNVLNLDGVSFGPIDVNRDNGTNGDPAVASDWFSICNVLYHYNSPSFEGERILFLYVDNSGSMTTATVQKSIELFLSNTNSNNITVQAVVNGIEDYVDPFISFSGTTVTTYAQLALIA